MESSSLGISLNNLNYTFSLIFFVESVAWWCGLHFLPALPLSAFLCCNQSERVYYPSISHFLPQHPGLSCLMLCQTLIQTSRGLFEKLSMCKDMSACIPNYRLFIYKYCVRVEPFNLVKVSSATAKLFCTVVSLASGMISHYPVLFIEGFTLPCLFQSPISFPTDQRLFQGATYLYKRHTRLKLLINLSKIKSWASII